MNESTLTQLKIIVERAVRPVQASVYRKRKMREELLSHLNAVFEEESSKLGNESTAMERTVLRFGNSAELTHQLQSSIPPSDWLVRLAETLDEFQPGESTLRRALRHALLALTLFGVPLFSAYVLQGRLHEWPIIVSAAVIVFSFTYMSRWMRDALYGSAGRSWSRAVLVAAESSLIIPGVTFVLCAAFSRELGSSLLSASALLPGALLLTWVPVTVCAYKMERRLRYRRDWDSLQIA